MSTYLRPTAPIATDVLLPSDPGVALALAQQLLQAPAMANHSHGLWGYSGSTAQGRALTVQATGIGGPSAATVLCELAEHGAARAIRIGACRALDPRLAPGDLVLVRAGLGADGASVALGGAASADQPLTSALAAALGSTATVVTIAGSDLHYDPAASERAAAWRRAGAAVADLETAALLACGRTLGVRVAAALAIGDQAGCFAGDELSPGISQLAAGAALALASGGAQGCGSDTASSA